MRSCSFGSLLLVSIVLLVFFLPEFARPSLAGEPTRVTVHVLAHDAKLIGTAAGGVRIVIRERDTNEILAQGTHTGGTGNTDLIVREPWTRGDTRLDTEGAAAFEATLDLERPTWVRIEAEGPMGSPSNAARTSRELLLIPGRDLDGDGVVLTLQGLIVHLLSPHAEVALESGGEIEISAGVKLLCTCPIGKDTLWNANDYVVEAELFGGGSLIARVPLSITDTDNVFAGSIDLPDLGEEEDPYVELRIVAGNPDRGNWGTDAVIFRLRR